MTTQVDVDRVRGWVGDTPDDQDVVDTLALYDDDADVAALSILRRLRANLVAGSAVKFSVEGDYSEDRTAQLAALDGLIATLEAVTGDSRLHVVVSSLFVRPGTGR